MIVIASDQNVFIRNRHTTTVIMGKPQPTLLSYRESNERLL